MDNILAGNGTTELIRLIALAYFGKNDRVLILKPTYGEYQPACQLMELKSSSNGRGKRTTSSLISRRPLTSSGGADPKESLSAIPTILPDSTFPERK